MILDYLLRALVALIAAICGIAAMIWAALLLFYVFDQGIEKANITWGSATILFGLPLFLFGGGLFLLYVALSYFRRSRFQD